MRTVCGEGSGTRALNVRAELASITIDNDGLGAIFRVECANYYLVKENKFIMVPDLPA